MMKRDVNALAGQAAGQAAKQYDLLIVGAGIYGAALAWEAVQRGLSVALVEQADFGGATSANSLKIIHGGLRYLQQADLPRMRRSIGERSTLMRIAPHLVSPLPVLMPTYGHGMKSREVMAVAMLANDIISFDRNRELDARHRIPNGKTIGKAATLRLLPDIPQDGLTGGALFYDALAHNSERLTLAYVRSAAAAGAQVANYARVTGFLTEADGTRVVGATVEDVLDGGTVEVRARLVINTAGPWLAGLLATLDGKLPPPPRLATSINVITRHLFDDYAVGLSSKQEFRDADALINKGSRLFFFVPWRGHTMIGTDYIPYDGQPDDFTVTPDLLQGFLAEINAAYPAGRLTLDDLTFVHAGLLPLSGVDAKTGGVRLVKHYRLLDHRQDGVDGLLSVLGVKYTTARAVAARTIDYAFRVWGQDAPPSYTRTIPLHGGDIPDMDAFVKNAEQEYSHVFHASLTRLLYNYGSAYAQVLACLDDTGEADDDAVIAAEARYAARHEMAYTLSDVILRRAGLGAAAHPGEDVLARCAAVLGDELGWDAARRADEIAAVQRVYEFD